MQILRPAKILVILPASLSVACAVIVLARRNNSADWIVAASLLTGGMAIVVNGLWLQYLAITNGWLIRVEWFGLHRRTFPLDDIEVRTRYPIPRGTPHS